MSKFKNLKKQKIANGGSGWPRPATPWPTPAAGCTLATAGGPAGP
jgi:hypothetical protein